MSPSTSLVLTSVMNGLDRVLLIVMVPTSGLFRLYYKPHSILMVVCWMTAIITIVAQHHWALKPSSSVLEVVVVQVGWEGAT